jgi:hypothetical protein
VPFADVVAVPAGVPPPGENTSTVTPWSGLPELSVTVPTIVPDVKVEKTGMDKAVVAIAPLESVTLKVNGGEPDVVVVGVPEITPVAESRERPVGMVPELIDQT